MTISPETIRSGFAEQVMKTLPFLRNKLAGHRQGADVVNVPGIYGELAMQLAATFHNFLISKHLERQPPSYAKLSRPSLNLLRLTMKFHFEHWADERISA